ncbi:MAG: methyltransferase domain-containing protein [Deltaproteobacteria bacterium]|nr:methyltransferase domain-containing protein [Deltaproteobacteria bacterium]
MARTAAFDRNTAAYESWFERHPRAYAAELRAVGDALPRNGRLLEVGVGSGRFAVPLGIRLGVEPSSAMGALARRRGVRVVRGVAEALPFGAGTFDGVVLVTTICFVDDPLRTMVEARRVLRPGGVLVIGFVDAASPLGLAYRRRAARSNFYREATFYTCDDLVALLERAGFRAPTVRQTLFDGDPERRRADAVLPGRGRGAFLVLRAVPRRDDRRTGSARLSDRPGRARRAGRCRTGA